MQPNPAMRRRGGVPALPLPANPGIQQPISPGLVPPPLLADPNPQFAANCLNHIISLHSESYRQAWEIIMDELPRDQAVKIAAEMTVSFQFHQVSKYRGKPFSYKNNVDSFHQRIERMIRNFVLVKAATLNETNHEQIMTAELSRSNLPDHPATILNDLLEFHVQFPDLFVKRNYQEDVQLLQELLKRYRVDFRRIPPSEIYQIVRPINAYNSQRLVIGCGQAITMCNGHPQEYTINSDPETNPDIVADYYSKEFWQNLPAELFQEVFFEGFAPQLYQQSLKEISRIVAPRGHVVMYLESCKSVLLDGNERLLKFFQECGFSRFEITKLSFRSCGQVASHDMVIVYK